MLKIISLILLIILLFVINFKDKTIVNKDKLIKHYEKSPKTTKQLEEICKRVEYPKFVNMLAFGKTPILSAAELEEMGFKMMVAPIDSILLIAHVMREMSEVFKRDGHTKSINDKMVGFDEIKSILGLSKYLEIEKNLK